MLHVMIVDDMEITRREIKRLKLWGEETGFVISQEAGNGYEAIEKLTKAPVDLVLTDIRMPKVDGIELLKKIMEKHLCPCVVLLSDYSEFSYARQGLILGAFDYMVKPIAEEDLKNLLLRAGDFIKEMQFEQERIKKLEQTLGEKLETFFPHSEVELLVEYIKRADQKAVEQAAYIADIVSSNTNNDIIRMQSLLNSIMHATCAGVLGYHKWLNRFLDKYKLCTTDYTACKNTKSIKKTFVHTVGNVIAILGKLQYGVKENDIVHKVCSYVLENIDGEVTLKSVSDQLFLNKSYISEVFKNKTGISFTEYLTTVKMERAKRLFEDGRLKTYEIAELLGYKDIEYFSRLFKKHEGVTPTEYRQNT